LGARYYFENIYFSVKFSKVSEKKEKKIVLIHCDNRNVND